MSLTNIQDLDNIINNYTEGNKKYNRCIKEIKEIEHKKTQMKLGDLSFEGFTLIYGKYERFYSFLYDKLICFIFNKNTKRYIKTIMIDNLN